MKNLLSLLIFLSIFLISKAFANCPCPDNLVFHTENDGRGYCYTNTFMPPDNAVAYWNESYGFLGFTWKIIGENNYKCPLGSEDRSAPEQGYCLWTGVSPLPNANPPTHVDTTHLTGGTQNKLGFYWDLTPENNNTYSNCS